MPKSWERVGGKIQKNEIMKKAIILFFVIFSFRVQSQPLPAGMTGLGLQQLVNSAIQNLTNAGTTLMGNGSIVIGGATSQLTGLMNQFNSTAQNDFTKPIESLSDNIKNLAAQIYSVTNRLNSILNQQQSCLVLNSQIFLTGVQQITSEMKIIGSPVNNNAAVNYFKFDGHSASIIPAEGGRVTIVGSKLWVNTRIPPVVKLYDENLRTVIATITPQRGQDNNSFSFTLDAQTIRQNVGKCLQLNVEPKQRKILKIQSLGVFNLPICIPPSYNSKIQIVGHLQYSCTATKQQVLDFRAFNFSNSSCEDRKNVSHTEFWDLRGGSILSTQYNGNIDQVNQSNIGVSISGNSITAAGWLDNASCINVFLGRKLLHDTHWNVGIAPKIQYNEVQVFKSDSSSGLNDLTVPSTQLCVPIAKSCDEITNNIFWFEIIRNDGVSSKTIYTSRQITQTTFADDFNGLGINAVLNPTPVGGKAQLCVTLTQAQCGF